ncbi:MAG: 4Fe-4S binding protein [Deltaproteobacteria bacterium]|nr:4Fe-4S binding protein [Deltaproteobacteria bacterium]MBW2257719.1 4Fe-4S binding protein [Deltaproteobacteria bacterium]
MVREIYRELQQRLDKYSMGFPATETEVEVRILEKLFTEDDARMFLAMSPRLEPAAQVAARLDRPEPEVEAKLEDMAERGLLFAHRKGDVTRYGAVPFVHGLFEFQVNRLDRELADLVERYFEDGFSRNMIDNAGHFLRTVPVNAAIPVEHQVASYEDAVEILEGKDTIVVAECICRKQRDTVDRSCGKPLEVCFLFGSMGQYYLDHEMGRTVSLDEATKILLSAQEAGLVTQPASSQNPTGMCNCCGDCCGVLRSINLHPRPAEIVFSNHFAVIDEDLCNACESCLDRCQVDALVLEDLTMQVNLDRCIGCGLCVGACPEEAITLSLKPEDQRRVPPRTSAEQMFGMAMKRGVI